jgi:crotonobetainyl-CoA:carnitine CoA-transferase CaiB-like acyl-CoA transferase
MPHNSPDGRGAGPLFTWYECADGRRLVFTMMQPERYWPEVARVLELDVLTDERFDTPEKRMAEGDALRTIVGERVASRTRDEWAAQFASTDVIWGPVQSPNEFVADPQVVANGYIVDAPRPGTEVITRVMSSPAQFDQQPITARWAAPDIGQHTDEVLQQLGWDAARIAAARSAGFLA